MSAETIVVLLLVGLVLLGALTAAVLVLRRSAEPKRALEADPTRPRVVAEVHAGEEQVLLHLARTLELPSGRDAVGYGEIYIAGSVGMTMRLASRSEIGRGFDGEIRLRRTRSASIAEYFVLRLPGDETIHSRVRGLDGRITDALRALDPSARIRAEGPSGLREAS